MPAPSSKKKMHQSPQEAIDEFWAKFNSKTPGRASNILPKEKDAPNSGNQPLRGISKAKDAASTYEEAAATCRAKVEAIVKECRRVNQKYRDPHFDMEFDLKWGTKDCLTSLKDTAVMEDRFYPGSVKRVGDIFEEPEFYKGGATAGDIRQGRDGDCWLMAALGTLGNKPGLIEKVCVARDEKIGVYGFVFHRDGEWISEIIDDKLYLTKPDYDESWIERNLIEDRQRINSEEDYRKIYQTGSGALYFAQCEDPNETWLPLLEKAYAKAHGDYSAIEGGFTGEALEDLTGGVTTELFTTDILDKDLFWMDLSQVNEEFLFGCAAGAFAYLGRGERKGIVEGHAYSILRAVEVDGKRFCLLRNPWGEYEWNGPWSDGSKEWTPEWMQKLNHRFGNDGSFWMSYEDLLQKYQTIDRTRLFVEDWKITQHWTSFNVSWATEYHSTKFAFTAEKRTSFVLVLSQLDDRYYCGLEGQYSFKLAFRVHKAGEEDYIVRSHVNYCMSRSVTAELDLDAGEYHVLVKIEAVKYDGSLAVEDVLRNNAKRRRDKLLRIGRAYDLAHAKGQIVESSEEKEAREKLEAKEKEKKKKEMKDKLMKEKERRKHVENKETRKTREAAAKRKAKAKANSKKAQTEAKKGEEKKENQKEGSETNEETRPEATQGKEDGNITKSESVEALSVSDPKPIENTALDSAPKEAEELSKVGETKESEPSTEKENNKNGKDGETEAVPTEAADANSKPETGAPEDEDDEDLSDIESIVSDITTGVVEEAVEEARLAAETAATSEPPADEEEDEFEKDPWNAVAVVGLRVYSKGSPVSIRVIRPKFWEGLDKESIAKTEKVENKLDVDDSAVDAATGEQVKKDASDDAQKPDDGSEGSIVVV
ncbi:hypothetical protein OIDMADRAFT_38228 [Oidiodendron maius Zn]|uniref:Calpain catalytic domain-containing protein n=1 Tax=Oidiodendron maius (strain Zn) TaxID=913774 RepID=A0A0C3DUJ1_OIDMZ|nr:hypothetical protein OIDMADRAFT_38228 [Oidiodendron maius Zn]